MCIFSRAVKHVSATKLFARREGSLQHLAYSMNFQSPDALAMLLPLPTSPGASESAVNFVDLSGYPKLFEDLDKGFPEPQSRGMSRGTKGFTRAASPLQVHSMGAFNASFAPSVSDLDRLDPQFRLPRDLRDNLGDYEDWGFAVVKLKPGSDVQKVHPIALTFPSTFEAKTLYFPTLHVHDGGELPRQADFDHTLYFQDLPAAPNDGWRRATTPASQHVKTENSKGFVLPDAPYYKKQIRGRHKNEDQYVR